MITLKHKGNFKNTERFLSNAQRYNIRSLLEEFGRAGVSSLSSATPVNTGLTAASWNFRIEIKPNFYSLTWFNTNVVNGTCIAILLQYGHGTRNGGYVQGLDYINPAMRPVFENFAVTLEKEVSKL